MLGRVLGRGPWSTGSARFVRDVSASLVATGLATLAFSHLRHEPPPAAPGTPPKFTERLTWEEESVPTRASRSYDSVAMFALPKVEPAAWSEPGHSAPRTTAGPPVRTLHSERPDRESRKVVAVPPSRPAALVLSASAPRDPVPVGTVAQAEAGQGGIQVFGWRLPGTDMVPAVLPAARGALDRMGSLGDEIVGAGAALAREVGLK